MSNESELTSGIDWANDEAVVRAAIGGGGSCWGGYGDDPKVFRIWSRALPGGTDPRSVLLGVGTHSHGAWRNAREEYPSVVAFEQQHRPSAPQDESMRITESGGTRNAEGDWPEDSSHENGNYECRCVGCGRHFIGHKRRVECKVCASKPVALGSGKGFEDWWALESWARLNPDGSEKVIARSAWNAALDSKPEGESKVTKPPQYDECYAELRKHLDSTIFKGIMAVRPDVLSRVLEYHDALVDAVERRES